MCPSLPMNYPVNRRTQHVELFTELLRRCFFTRMKFADQADVRIGQLGERTAFTNGARMIAAFCHHVGYIIGLRSEKEMHWINTGRMIAAMEHGQPVRNRPPEQLKGYAACYQVSSLLRSGDDSSVSQRSPATDPGNTAVGHLSAEVAKETINERRFPELFAADQRAEFATTTIDYTRVNKEGLVASGAGSCDFARLTWHTEPLDQVQV